MPDSSGSHPATASAVAPQAFHPLQTAMLLGDVFIARLDLPAHSPLPEDIYQHPLASYLQQRGYRLWADPANAGTASQLLVGNISSFEQLKADIAAFDAMRQQQGARPLYSHPLQEQPITLPDTPSPLQPEWLSGLSQHAGGLAGWVYNLGNSLMLWGALTAKGKDGQPQPNIALGSMALSYIAASTILALYASPGQPADTLEHLFAQVTEQVPDEDLRRYMQQNRDRLLQQGQHLHQMMRQNPWGVYAALNGAGALSLLVGGIQTNDTLRTVAGALTLTSVGVQTMTAPPGGEAMLPVHKLLQWVEQSPFGQWWWQQEAHFPLMQSLNRLGQQLGNWVTGQRVRVSGLLSAVGNAGFLWAGLRQKDWRVVAGSALYLVGNGLQALASQPAAYDTHLLGFALSEYLQARTQRLQQAEAIPLEEAFQRTIQTELVKQLAQQPGVMTQPAALLHAMEQARQSLFPATKTQNTSVSPQTVDHHLTSPRLIPRTSATSPALA